MLTNGVDVYTAASRLGHDPYVLLKVYSRFIDSADDAAAELAEQLLRLATAPASAVVMIAVAAWATERQDF